MQQALKAAPSGHAEANRKFANDASFESVDRMLTKIAAKCYARVQAMGLGMTFDDVRQEMNLSYLLAKEKWNPEVGVLFSTYLTTSCYRNFNTRIGKAEVERRNLGLVNFTDMRVVGAEPGEDVDVLEWIDAERSPRREVSQMFGNVMIDGGFDEDVDFAPMHYDPSELLEGMQEHVAAKEKARTALSNLTPKAKALVRSLLSAEKSRLPGEHLPSIRSLLLSLDVSQSEMTRIRKELVAAFGAKL